MLENFLSELMKNEYFIALKQASLPHLKELSNYRFSLSNPIFWLFMLLLLFIVSRRWGMRKSFSFCLAITLVLLTTTHIEKRFAGILSQSQLFDAGVVKLISLFIISIIAIYYLFVKDI